MSHEHAPQPGPTGADHAKPESNPQPNERVIAKLREQQPTLSTYMGRVMHDQQFSGPERTEAFNAIAHTVLAAQHEEFESHGRFTVVKPGLLDRVAWGITDEGAVVDPREQALEDLKNHHPTAYTAMQDSIVNPQHYDRTSLLAALAVGLIDRQRQLDTGQDTTGFRDASKLADNPDRPTAPSAETEPTTPETIATMLISFREAARAGTLTSRGLEKDFYPTNTNFGPLRVVEWAQGTLVKRPALASLVAMQTPPNPNGPVLHTAYLIKEMDEEPALALYKAYFTDGDTPPPNADYQAVPQTEAEAVLGALQTAIPRPEAPPDTSPITPQQKRALLNTGSSRILQPGKQQHLSAFVPGVDNLVIHRYQSQDSRGQETTITGLTISYTHYNHDHKPIEVRYNVSSSAPAGSKYSPDRPMSISGQATEADGSTTYLVEDPSDATSLPEGANWRVMNAQEVINLTNIVGTASHSSARQV